LGRDLLILDVPFAVLTPMGESVRVDGVYRNCAISIERVNNAFDLMILEMMYQINQGKTDVKLK